MAELRKIWRESTQSAGLFGEAPIYLDLLKKIRNINLTLPGQSNSWKRCPMPEPDFDNDYLNELNRRRKILRMKAIDKN